MSNQNNVTKENHNFKDITITIIFEGSALNRDEKIGGNIQSIKKLTVGDKVVSFISRPAIRHYLFNTLVKSFPDDWEPATITGQGSVAQFDILQDDIINSAELDAFGYMYTIGGENSLTRKAPVGITKAVALYSYNQDMAFYANHGLVQRANQNGLNITPNPFQREEHTSLYKLSFTIDSKILGEDSWVVNNKPNHDSNKKTLTIEVKKPQSIKLIVEKKIDENDESIIWYEVKDKKIFINGKEIKIENGLVKKDEKKNVLKIKGEEGEEDSNSTQEDVNQEEKKKKKKKSKELIIEEFEEIEEDDKKYYKFSVTREPTYDDNSKTLTIETGIVKTFNNVYEKQNSNSNSSEKEQKEYEIKDKDQIIGSIKVEEKSINIYKVSFNISEKLKERRISQILTAIHDGLVAHSSGEDNTIIPLFLIAAPVKVPSPVFHPYIDIVIEDGKPKVIGIQDCINNSWVEEENGSKKVYLQDCERLKVITDNMKSNLFDSWEDFLKACGLKNNNFEEQKQTQ